MDPRQAAVDVFFVHSSSYVGSRWNAPADDPTVVEATDRVGTGIQAAAFSGCCAIHAPRYRQANLTAFYRPSPDGDRAIALAYEDVRYAFEAFEARRAPGRPFILAGHSQGSVHAERLLYEVVAFCAVTSTAESTPHGGGLHGMPTGESSVSLIMPQGAPSCCETSLSGNFSSSSSKRSAGKSVIKCAARVVFA